MGSCKCGKEMFLFEDGMYTIVHICPHCGLALQIHKNHYLVKWIDAKELNIYIGEIPNVSEVKEPIPEKRNKRKN